MVGNDVKRSDIRRTEPLVGLSWLLRGEESIELDFPFLGRRESERWTRKKVIWDPTVNGGAEKRNNLRAWDAKFIDAVQRMEMEMGGDVRAYIGKYGVVSEKATTGLLKKKKAFLVYKQKGKILRERKRQITSKRKVLTFCGVWRKTEWTEGMIPGQASKDPKD